MSDAPARLRAALADRYRVERELGAGGMATVYLAHDVKHDRDVAIKVLHPDLGAALGGERFLAEIRTTARLQHPHILPLLDSGEAGDGLLYYVMPFVRGETLRARLERERQLPVDDALRIARAVADALQHAHGQGIIHRDIKPENILLQDGHALVADFGIALAVQQAGGARLTQTGLSLGTPQYMSPEQAMGERTLDARSDQYALAAVTYELLAGEPPFTGPTVQAVVARLLSDAPRPLAPQRRAVPAPVDAAISRALEKLPADRFPTIGAFAAALVPGGPTSVPTLAAPPSAPLRRWPVALGAAAVSALLSGGGAWWGARATAPTPDLWTRLQQLTDATGVETNPALAPDGGAFAYASDARGTWDVYVQRVGARTPQLVAGDSTADELWPSWSPDGRQLAYARAGDGIWIAGATGENARRLSRIGTMPRWSPDGTRLAIGSEEVQTPRTLNTFGRLWTIAVAGGAPRAVRLEGVRAAYQPGWSPDGRRLVAFALHEGRRDIITVPAEGGAVRFLTRDQALDWAPTWANDGHVYFASDRGGSMGIWRIAVDEASGEARGTPELVAAGGDASFDLPQVSADGRRVLFRSLIESVNPAAVPFDPTTATIGAARLLQRRTASLAPTDVSPDGEWLALHSALGGQQDLWLMRRDGRDLRRVTDDEFRDWYPRFTPDGQALTFFSNRAGVYQGWRIGTDGSGVQALTAVDSGVYFPAFAPDGERLVLTTLTDGARLARAPWPVRREDLRPLGPARIGDRILNLTVWSPDGRRLAGYLQDTLSNIRGRAVVDAVSGTAQLLDREADGIGIEWLPDARRVIYFTGAGTLVLQDVESRVRRAVTGSLPWPADQTRSLAIARDGRTLYYGARQAEANLWIVERGQP